VGVSSRKNTLMMVLWLVWITTPIDSHAAHVRDLNLSQMVERSQVITQAHVVAVRAHRSAHNPKRVVTTVTVQMQRVFRHDRAVGPGAFETFVVPGGVVGRYGQKVSGSPRFQVGQEVIVLLQRHPTLDWLTPVGLAQGRYVIDRSGLNRPIAIRDRRGLALMRSQPSGPWLRVPSVPAIERQPLAELLKRLGRLVKTP
jgi:hypothetical protein